MNSLPVVYQIIMLFLIMGTGLLARKTGIFNDGVIKGMNGLVLNITWPALMIVTTQKENTPETLGNFLLILVLSIVILSLLSVACFLAFRHWGRDVAPAMALLSALPNAGFFGIPIIQALYGDTGLFYLSAFIIGFNVAMWTVAISTYTGFNLRTLKNLINPGLICALIGIALFLLSVKLPVPVYGWVNQLATMNTPLSMLILGARLETIRPGMLIDGRMWLTILIKLVLMPMVVLFALRLCGVSGMPLMLMTVASAMPSAASTQMLTERYGGDVSFTAKSTSVSTLCSLATLPLVLWLMGIIV